MGAPFKTRVYQIVQDIPKGKVATYRQIAALAGNPRAARVVGMYMSQNKDPKTVPCHRVVGTDGRFRGYAFGRGITTKKDLLLREGVAIEGDRVALDRSQWHPS